MMKKGANNGSLKSSSCSSNYCYTAEHTDYNILEEIGNGASAIVYRAIYVPTNEIVAVKCLDLDRCNSNLDDIRRETQTMSLIDHPNLIKSYCSFVVEHFLWVVMPFMAEGSCLHLMKTSYTDGFEESVICSILKETLRALEYLHRHGHIHRDIKAGNILLDNSGLVKLGDFGVSACMFDQGDRKRARNTFVGTPCWMAPEVLQPGGGYDFKADIWSFGITALELAHGHAPFSKYPPMKVLLMTLQNAPPGLDYDRDKRFSKLKDAAQLALKKMPSTEQEALSQSEYQRGVSAWNFDIDDLKFQVSMIQDDKDISKTKEYNGSLRVFTDNKDLSTTKLTHGTSLIPDENNCREIICDVEGSGATCSTKVPIEPVISVTNNLEAQDESEKSRTKNELMPSMSKQGLASNNWKNQAGSKHLTYSGPLIPSSTHNSLSERGGHNSDRSENESQLSREKNKHDVRKNPNFSGPIMLPNRASANSLSAPIRSSGGYGKPLDDKSKTNMVQIKGRFSVTSQNIDLVKEIPSGSVSSSTSQFPKKSTNQFWKEATNSSGPASILTPHLQNLLQQTSFQQNSITNMLSGLQQNELVDVQKTGILAQNHNTDNDTAEMASTERKRFLLLRIAELQTRMSSLTDDLTAEKFKHIQLQEQFNRSYRQGDSSDY